MSLRLYCGEYLVSPVPLHWGMNHCSHNCWYCFANLNRGGRRMENDDLARVSRWYAKGSGPLLYWFLKKGYPMLVSNDTDPFCRSNADSFRALFELSQSLGFRLSYQTKGGDEEIERLALEGPKTMIYVTLTSDDSALLKSMEPGAPSAEQRLEFIAEAVRRGHFVVVGLNPLVPAWWRNFDVTLGRLHEIGVRHLVKGELHFSRFQVDAMSPGKRERYADVIKYGMLKAKPDAEIMDAMMRGAESMGFSVFDEGCSSKPGFWRPYFDLGFPFFPTLDGWFEELERVGKGRPVCFDFDAFQLWAGHVNAPEGLSIYRDYLQPYARSLRNKKENMKVRSFREVHELEWRVMEYPTRLRSRYLALAVVTDQGKESLLVDDEDRELMVYVPGGAKDNVYPADEAVYIHNPQ